MDDVNVVGLDIAVHHADRVRRLQEREAGRHGSQEPPISDDLGRGRGREEAHHAVARTQIRDVSTDLAHDPGPFAPRGPGVAGIRAERVHDVAEVHPRRPEHDPGLPWSELPREVGSPGQGQPIQAATRTELEPPRPARRGRQRAGVLDRDEARGQDLLSSQRQLGMAARPERPAEKVLGRPVLADVDQADRPVGVLEADRSHEPPERGVGGIGDAVVGSGRDGPAREPHEPRPRVLEGEALAEPVEGLDRPAEGGLGGIAPGAGGGVDHLDVADGAGRCELDGLPLDPVEIPGRGGHGTSAPEAELRDRQDGSPLLVEGPDRDSLRAGVDRGTQFARAG